MVLLLFLFLFPQTRFVGHYAAAAWCRRQVLGLGVYYAGLVPNAWLVVCHAGQPVVPLPLAAAVRQKSC